MFFDWLCRVGILYSVIKIVSGFVEVYFNIVFFLEVFLFFVFLLDVLKNNNVFLEVLMVLIIEVS